MPEAGVGARDDVTQFQDLPLAHRDRAWDSDAADVVNGELKVVPHAVHSAAGIMQGARGGVKIPAGDVDRVKAHLAKYYAKLGETPPWES